LTPDLFSKSFVLNPQNTVSIIKGILGGRGIDVIVGISMGGLILPFVAEDHPEAKLIFIATGPSLKTKSRFFNLFFKLLKNPFILKCLSWILFLPDNVLTYFYRLANPFNGSEKNRMAYEKDMFHNIELIRRIPIEEEAEIIDFASRVNNNSLLEKLLNQTLIYNGKKDLFMPAERGEELHKLLTNSRLIINNGEHFDVFTEENLKEWDQFIEGDSVNKL